MTALNPGKGGGVGGGERKRQWYKKGEKNGWLKEKIKRNTKSRKIVKRRK